MTRKRTGPGSPLPACPSTLDRFPIGCAVELDLSSGHRWYQILNRIGTGGSYQLRPLDGPPTEPDWFRSAPNESYLFSPVAPVFAAMWPGFAAPSADASVDPFGAEGEEP